MNSKDLKIGDVFTIVKFYPVEYKVEKINEWGIKYLRRVDKTWEGPWINEPISGAEVNLLYTSDGTSTPITRKIALMEKRWKQKTGRAQAA